MRRHGAVGIGLRGRRCRAWCGTVDATDWRRSPAWLRLRWRPGGVSRLGGLSGDGGACGTCALIERRLRRCGARSGSRRDDRGCGVAVAGAGSTAPVSRTASAAGAAVSGARVGAARRQRRRRAPRSVARAVRGVSTIAASAASTAATSPAAASLVAVGWRRRCLGIVSALCGNRDLELLRRVFGLFGRRGVRRPPAHRRPRIRRSAVASARCRRAGIVAAVARRVAALGGRVAMRPRGLVPRRSRSGCRSRRAASKTAMRILASAGMRSRWPRPACWDCRTLALDATGGTVHLSTRELPWLSGAIPGPARNFEKLPNFQRLVRPGRRRQGRARPARPAGPAARTADQRGGTPDPRCAERGNPYNKDALHGPPADDVKERGSAAARDAQFARTGGTARGHARGRRDVGRRRFLGDGGAPEGRGLRRRRRHAAALRPWRGDAPQGRLLRRPGHPRRPRGRRAGSASRTTCSTTKAASRRR